MTTNTRRIEIHPNTTGTFGYYAEVEGRTYRHAKLASLKAMLRFNFPGCSIWVMPPETTRSR